MSARLPLRPRLVSLAATVLVAAGLILRLRAYFSGRSLWLDEAMLALNIFQRNFFELLKPLDYKQGAPLGFLLAQKLFTSLLGNSDLALRLLPFLAGCATLILFALLLRRALPPIGFLLALALMAFSPTLVYYSAESKQYMLDAALTVTVLWLSLPRQPTNHPTAPPDNRPTGQPDNRSAICSAILLWFSHPLIFVLAGIGLSGLIFDRAQRRVWLLSGSVWLASFGLLYIVNLRGLAQDTFLLNYWREFFLPLDGQALPWLADRLNGLFSPFNQAGLATNSPLWLNLAGLIVGTAWLARRAPRLAVQVGLTFFFALTASGLGKYPFGGRMALFLLPLAALLMGAAAQALFEGLRRLGGRNLARLGSAALSVSLLLGPIQVSAERLVQPFQRENIYPALSALRGALRPDDFLYIYPAASAAFLVYAPRYQFETFTAGDFHQGWAPTEQIFAELEPAKSAPRLWVLFAHVYEKGDFNEMEAALAFLDRDWRCKTHTRAPGTGVTLSLCVKR